MNHRVICLSLTLLIVAGLAAGASTLSDLSRDMAAIAKQASPASVQIDAERSIPQPGMIFGAPLDSEMKMPKSGMTLTRSVGSGFVIDPKGYILTSADVVSNAQNFSVRFSDGTTAPGKLIGSDPVVNCALIKVEKTGLKALALGDSDSLQPGMLVVTVNSQAGMANSVSLGVVAATDRQAVSSAGPVLQISGTIGPGASGGAVLDTEGRVVGITFAMFSPTSRVAPFNLPKILIQPSGSNKGAQVFPFSEEAMKALKDMRGVLGAYSDNVPPEEVEKAYAAARDMWSSAVDVSRTSGSSGFAIPINQIKPIVETLKSGKTVEHAALGMRLDQTPEGIVVKPSSGSPAEKAGVKEGDMLVSIDGRRFATVASITAYITSLRAGDKVSVVVSRDGKEIPITITAASRSEVIAAWPDVSPSPTVRPQVKRTFSLSLNDAGIAEVAKALSEASGVSVVVANPENIKGKVTIHLKSTNLETALPLICDALGCKFARTGNSYVLKPSK